MNDDGGRQPDVSPDRVGPGRDVHHPGRRAYPGPHLPGQAHAGHPARMDGRDAGPGPPAAAWPRPTGRTPRWGPMSAERRPPGASRLGIPVWTRATLSRSPGRSLLEVCHITAIPGLQIILAVAAMSGGLYDANMLALMLDGISAAGSSSRPPISCLHVVQRRVRLPVDFWMDMISLSIRQRRGAANRARPTGGGRPDRLAGTSVGRGS